MSKLIFTISDSSEGTFNSDDAFNNTAPRKEFLADTGSCMTADPFNFGFPIKISSTIIKSIEPVSISIPLKTFKPIEKESINIEISDEYKKYIESIPEIKEFGDIMQIFLQNFFKTYPTKPIKCQLSLFKFPGEVYQEPMIKIIFPDSGELDILKIKDQIEENLKIELANSTPNLEQFKQYRKIHAKFRIVVRRD